MVVMYSVDNTNTSVLVLAIAMAKLSAKSINEDVMQHVFCCASLGSEGCISTGK